MAKYAVYTDDLTSVANAIRSATGGTTSLAFPSGFVSEIENLTPVNPYAGIYEKLAFRSVINASDPYISEWANSLSSLEISQFAGMRWNGNITFNNLTNIPAYAFAHPYTDLDFGPGTYTASLNFPNVSIISNGAFANYNQYLNISLPICTSILTHVFESARLYTISAPSVVFIGASAFRQNAIKSIDFPLCTTIDSQAFYGAYQLSSVSLPECTYISFRAFYTCGSLNFLNIPNVSFIASSAFFNCSKLSNLNLLNCTVLDQYAFGNCFSLSSISTPKLENIGSYAFQFAEELTTISLPKVSYISKRAFASCYHLLSVYLLNSVVCNITSTDVFYATPISQYTTSTGGVYGKIYVPSSLYNSYITATNWTAYSSRIVSM